MYVDIETGRRVSLIDLASLNNCSIPPSPNAEAVERLGIAELVQTEAPSPQHTPGDNERIDGRWTTTWIAPDTVAPERPQRLASGGPAFCAGCWINSIPATAKKALSRD